MQPLGHKYQMKLRKQINMEVTDDASQHTTSQRDGPLPRIREVFWVAWVSFVKIYLL